jgi:hypothetical protein
MIEDPLRIPTCDYALFFGLESRRLGKGGICWWEASVGSSEDDSTSFAFFPVTRTPTKPATTSKVPAIISQCGNPNDAIMSLADAPFSSPEGNETW